MKIRRIIITLAAILAAGYSFNAYSCTAVVVSGKHNASGRTLLIKVRDSDRIGDLKAFKGPKYDFFGQTTTVENPQEKIRGVVSGSNTAGLCLASLTPGKGFPLDTVKATRVSGGKLIYRALGSCANLAEFEELVNEIMKTRICVTHIAAMDAEGHGATYEMIGKTYVKYDVDDPAVSPGGFRAMTNFTFAGDPTLGNGQVRYDSAVEIMNSLPRNAEGKFDLDPVSLMDAVCRTFLHTGNKIKGLADIADKKYYSGEDFITRNRTNTISIFESALPGEDASKVAMWINLASPITTPAIPVIVTSGFIPDYLTSQDFQPAAIVAGSMAIRNKYVYDSGKSKPFAWFNVANVIALQDKTREVESYVKSLYCPKLSEWRSGAISDEEFFRILRSQAPLYYGKFVETVMPGL